MEINDEVQEFEPIKGRVMREYVLIPETLFYDQGILEKCIAKSMEFIESLPEKK